MYFHVIHIKKLFENYIFIVSFHRNSLSDPLYDWMLGRSIIELEMFLTIDQINLKIPKQFCQIQSSIDIFKLAKIEN